MKTETRRMLLKSRTECNAKLEKLQIRYGLGEISDEVYQTTYKHLNAEIARINNLRYSVDYQRVTVVIKQKRQLIFINCRFLSTILTNYRTIS